MKTTKELETDLTYFLNMNPHMKPFQSKIDGILSKCPTQEVRMVMAFEMWMDSKDSLERLTEDLMDKYDDRINIIHKKLGIVD